MCVTDGPDSLTITGPKSIHAGDLTTLYCSAKSVPAATVTWTFDRKPTNVEEAVCVLPSVRQSDGGTYSCTAVNAATGQNQTAGRALTVAGMREIKTDVVGLAIIATAGCCVSIAIISAVIAFCLVRWKR